MHIFLDNAITAQRVSLAWKYDAKAVWRGDFATQGVRQELSVFCLQQNPSIRLGEGAKGMSDKPKLLPCPFCGGEAQPTAHLEYSWCSPVCMSCGVRGPSVRIDKNSSQQKLRELMGKADDLWNTRAEDAKTKTLSGVSDYLIDTLLQDDAAELVKQVNRKVDAYVKQH